MKSLNFNDPQVARVLRAWWTEMAQERGDRAELRRVQSVHQTAFVPIFHRLWGRLQRAECKVWPESLARVVCLLAHVREDSPKLSLGRQMATQNGAGPTVSQDRVRRILDEEDPDSAAVMLRDALSQLRGRVNLCDLANTAYWWTERTRKNLAYEYYANVREKKIS